MPIIKAKYAGRCYSCGDQYEVGDEVYWNKGDAPLCVGCHEEDTANAASPVKPVQQGVTARFHPPTPKPHGIFIKFLAEGRDENHNSIPDGRGIFIYGEGGHCQQRHVEGIGFVVADDETWPELTEEWLENARKLVRAAQ